MHFYSIPVNHHKKGVQVLVSHHLETLESPIK